MSRKLIENAVIQLIQDDRFYGEFLQYMKLNIDHKIPTAGVNVINGQVQLYVNPEFWNKYDTYAQSGILKHECLHIMHEHLNRMTWSPEANIAADVAINQFIPQFGTVLNDFWSVEKLSEMLGVKLLPKETAEYYLAEIRKNDPTGQKLGTDKKTLDDHSVWEKGEKGEATKELIKGIVKEAANKVGNIPSELESLIAALNKGKITWQSVLRRFVANAEEIYTVSSRFKRNRRYGIKFPGHKIERKLKIAMITDSSGSVPDKAYEAFIQEGNGIAATGAEITWMQADCVVNSTEKWKKSASKTRKGYGGTAYDPAIQKAKELKVDCIIYFGDMDAADVPKDPGIPTLWVVYGNQKPPGNFGQTIKLELKE
jgi:predicted metal-dependent peptidase